MVSRHLAAAVIAAVTAVGACAHKPSAPTDPYVADSVARMRGWFAGLPRCPPRKPSDETPSFRHEEVTDAIAVRGKLMLAGAPECTATVCRVDCCNTCSLRWVVVPDASDAPVRELAIQKPGANPPLSAEIKECKLDSVRQEISPPRVSVSGFLETDVIIHASMCVIEEPPAPKVK